MRFLNLYHSHEQIMEEIEAAFREVVTTSSFVGGKRIELLENSFADFVGSTDCVGVANGTDAIEIAIESLGAARERKIITQQTHSLRHPRRSVAWDTTGHIRRCGTDELQPRCR